MKKSEAAQLARVRRLVADGTARRLRVAAGFSYGEIGRLTQSSGVTVWRYEHGHRVPHGPVALRYLAALEMLEKVAAS